jgi:hypothetical protein
MFLISSITTQASKLVTDSIKAGWDTTWDTAFNGVIFKILAQLGAVFAVCTLLIWIIIFFNDFANDRSYYKFGEIIWPIVVILLLVNGGSNLITITTGLRGIINNANDKILTQILAQADLNTTLDALSNYTNLSVFLKSQATQCYSLQSAEQQACIDRVLAQAQEVKSAYDASFLDVAGALSAKLGRDIDAIGKNPLGAVIAVTSFPTNSAGLLLAESIMLASLAAFQGLIEISFLLTGLLGPIAVGTSLLPIGAKPLYAWFTAFWSLGIAKLSLNIIVGLVAISVSTSGENTGLSSALLLGVLSPILALAMASGGGIAIFNSIVAAASAAASVGVSFLKGI